MKEEFYLQGSNREENKKGSIFIHWRGGVALIPPGSISECIFMCAHMQSTSILFSCKDILCGFWGDVWGSLFDQGNP